MSYFEKYATLKKIREDHSAPEIKDKDFELVDQNFVSKQLIGDQNIIKTGNKNAVFNALLSYYLQNNSFSNSYIFRNLNAPDNSFEENYNFTYSILRKKNSLKSGSAIILLHGLNEKNWDKYLPWAQYLLEKTGRPIIMFPIAYHMNRAPKEWSNPRLMAQVSKERKKLFPNLDASTFVNAALSTRLQFSPERFFLSGLQSLYDVIHLVETIRDNENPYISKDAEIDFFGYSIGGFFGQILLMSNPQNLFGDSRLLIFCGGATLDFTTPISRAIIDSEAAISLKNFFLEGFEENMKTNESFHSIFARSEEIGIAFQSMINSGKLISFRNAILTGMKDRIRILGLEKDGVFRPKNIAHNFPGRLSHCLKFMDFNFSYSHETPFPLLDKIENEVNNAFETVLSYSASFLA